MWSEGSSESHGMAFTTLRNTSAVASLSERTDGFSVQPLSLLVQGTIERVAASLE